MSESLLSYLRKSELLLKRANAFLERLDNKVRIDPSKEEHQHIEKYAYGFVKSVIDKIEDRFPDCGITLIKAGSYYSDLRVGRPYEFDFMVEFPVPTIVSIGENYIPDFGQNVFSAFTFPGFKRDIYRIIDDCISKLKLENNFNIFSWSDAFSLNSPAICCQLVYKQNCGILIDIVPCIKYPSEHFSELPALKPSILKFLQECLENGDETEHIRESMDICNFGESSLVDYFFGPQNPKPTMEHDEHASETMKTESDNFVESCSKYPGMLEFFENKIYLVLTDQYRLSTSLIEQYILKHVQKIHKTAFRIIKYLLQTYHVCGDPHTEEEDMFGVESRFGSRVFTLMFIESSLTIPRREDNVAHIVAFFLDIITTKDYTWLSNATHGNLFTPKSRFSNRRHDDYLWSYQLFTEVFEYTNLSTIQQFLLKAIEKDNLDVFYLTSRSDNVACECCFSVMDGQEIISNQCKETKYFNKQTNLPIELQDVARNTCYMHKVIGGCKKPCCTCRVLVYQRP